MDYVMNTIEQLQKLVELKERGILTEDEFQQQKIKLLNSNSNSQEQPVKPSILEELSDLDSHQNTSQKNSTFRKIFKLVLFIIMVLVVINFVNSEYNDYKNSGTQNVELRTQQSDIQVQPSQPEIIYISVLDLAKEYSENEVKTDEKYKNKLMRISGDVQAISKDFADNLVLELSSDNQFLPANMRMEKSEKSKMMNITKDEHVVVQCQKTSYIMNSPTGYNCVLISD